MTCTTWNFISEFKQISRGGFECIYWLYMYFWIKTAFIINYAVKTQKKITIFYNPFLCSCIQVYIHFLAWK